MYLLGLGLGLGRWPGPAVQSPDVHQLKSNHDAHPHLPRRISSVGALFSSLLHA